MASTYYIAASGSGGSDSNPGTLVSPFATFSHAGTVAVAGDILLGNGGDTITDHPSFTVGLTLGSYGVGRCTIAAGTNNVLFTLSADQNITLTNLIFTNSSTVYAGGGSTEVVKITQSTGPTRFTSGITITGCDFTGGQNGLRIFQNTTDSGGWNGITITGCLFYNCSLTGFYIHGGGTFGTTHHYSNVTISNNTAHDITGNTLSSGTGYGWGMNLAYADTAAGSNIISGNLCYNMGASSSTTTAGGGIGIQTLGCNGITISGNVCHDCNKSGTNDGTGIDMDQGNQNNLIEYNVCYNCGGGGISSFSEFGQNGNVWRFNLLVNCGSQTTTPKTGAMWFSGQSDGQAGIQIYNNTVISLQGNPCVGGLSGFAAFNNKKIYNNIFYCASGPCVIAPVNGTGTAIDYNYFLSGTGFSATYNAVNYTTLATWRSNSSYDTHSLGDTASPFIGAVTPIPAFVPGSNLLAAPIYSLAAGSVPQGTGGDLSSLFSITPGTQDCLGYAIPVPYSMGAINPVYALPTARLGGGSPLLMFF